MQQRKAVRHSASGLQVHPHRPVPAGIGRAAVCRPTGFVCRGSCRRRRKFATTCSIYHFEGQRFDTDLGRIIEALERAGELSNTIIVVTSDNGMPFPRAKANVYDAGVRVPLAIRWPGVVKAGTAIDSFVSLTDIAPTLLESAGLKPPEAMTGRSLPAMKAEPQPGRDRVFIERERHANVRRFQLSRSSD